MREPPPAQLTEKLQGLGLATARDLESVEATVHRMAGNLPRFESVWIDALRQARILTHFQASEIHAGRFEALKVERYVLCQPVHEYGYCTVYRAEDRQSRETVRLALFSVQAEYSERLLARLNELVTAGKSFSNSAGMIFATGFADLHLWAASPWVEGTSLADFVLRYGRLSGEAVLQIARAMLRELVALEDAGVIHSDIGLPNVLIAADGEVRIPHAGLRGAVRPREGFSSLDLAADACSTLAPERITAGTPPTAASDLFACGCVWWHILCGRPPLGGGDTMSRLRAAQAAAIGGLQKWAADVPDVLADAVRECLQKDPRRRPKSMADLAKQLGPLRRQGRQAIVRCMATAARPRAPWLRSTRSQGKKPARSYRLTAATLVIVASVAVAWPLWVAHHRPSTNSTSTNQANLAEAKTQAGRIAISMDKLPRQPTRSPLLDTAVTPAGYSAAINPSRTVKTAHEDDFARPSENKPSSGREELTLPTDRPVRGEALDLKPGLRVRAQGGRARIVVPRSGLAVQANRVSFENVDFVAAKATDLGPIDNTGSPALVRLLASECEFVGCSFQSADGSPELSAAIVWQHSHAEIAAASLPTGRIRLKDCVFRRIGVGIESHLEGAVDFEMVNSLHLGPGPMIRLTHAPAADEPHRIVISQVTLRGADALLDIRCANLRDRSGEVTIEASGCVLAPRVQAALVTLTANAFPESLLQDMKWTGQGSVLAGQVLFGQWTGRDGARQTVDDATISIAGLVRGQVEFAGKCDGEPASSRVVDCQAPLQNSESAGTDTRDLPPEIEAGRRLRP